MKLFVIIFIIYSVFIDLTLANVELPCIPYFVSAADEYSCSVRNIPGDLTQESVLIRPEKPKQTTNVTISDVRLGNLPHAFFQLFPNVKYLTLTRCSIKSLDSFEGSSSLQWLQLSENLISRIGEGQLSRRIRVLEMPSNRIRKIHERAFEPLTKLSWVDLSNNRLQKLPMYVFTQSLTYINLEHNKLGSIEHLFSDLSKLTHLNVAHNRIRDISRSAFQGSKNLTKLDLSWNRIETIDTKAFDSLEQLQILILTGNKLLELVIGTPSSNLQVLAIDHNVLFKLVIRKSHKWYNGTHMNLYANNNKLAEVILQQGLPLKEVHLQNNNLMNLLPITGFKQLQFVDMSNNDLSRVNFKDLNSVPNLEVLTLQNTRLQPHQLQQIFNLNQVWLVWLDVSENSALSNFEFGDTTDDSHIETLIMNSCNLVALHPRKIKQTLPRLRQLVVEKNNFTCHHLQQKNLELKAMDVMIIGDFYVSNESFTVGPMDGKGNGNSNNKLEDASGGWQNNDKIEEYKYINGIQCY